MPILLGLSNLLLYGLIWIRIQDLDPTGSSLDPDRHFLAASSLRNVILQKENFNLIFGQMFIFVILNNCYVLYFSGFGLQRAGYTEFRIVYNFCAILYILYTVHTVCYA